MFQAIWRPFYLLFFLVIIWSFFILFQLRVDRTHGISKIHCADATLACKEAGAQRLLATWLSNLRFLPITPNLHYNAFLMTHWTRWRESYCCTLRFVCFTARFHWYAVAGWDAHFESWCSISDCKLSPCFGFLHVYVFVSARWWYRPTCASSFPCYENLLLSVLYAGEAQDEEDRLWDISFTLPAALQLSYTRL